MSSLALDFGADGSQDRIDTRTASLASEKIRRVLLVASALGFCLAALSIWRFTFDDSYIGFRYADHLARGLGLVYNTGERVEGYTDFLWVVALAGVAKTGVSLIAGSKLLAVLLTLSTLVAVYLLSRAVSTSKVHLCGVALPLTATSTYFITSNVTGLETPLFVALLCWALLAYLKAYRMSGRNTHVWWAVAAVLLGLLVMTRPDGVLVYAALWVYSLKRFRREPLALAYFTFPFLFLYLPYFVWRWHYYGFFFPNTFYAKRGGTLALFSKGLSDTGKFFGLQMGGWFLAGVVGCATVFLPATETTVLALPIASRVAFELWSGGVSPGEFHFLIPALPLFWVLAERIVTMGVASMGVRGWALAAGIASALIVMQVAAFAGYRQHHVRSVEEGMERAHIAIGRWLKDHAPPGATIAAGDIGAIGLWSQLRVIDVDGITDGHVSHLPGVFPWRRDSRYVINQAPEFVMLRTSNCQPGSHDLLFGMDQAIYSDPQFTNNYAWEGCWEFWPRYDLVLYQQKSSRRVAQSDSSAHATK